jgi:hypothetical protein
MGRAYSMHGEKNIADMISAGREEEKDHWKNLDVDVRVLLIWI